jgi:hypothetical protein
MRLVQIQTLLLLLMLSLAGAPDPAQARPAATPRAVTPRGALDAEEQNNIAVFKNVSPSVVNITALGLERDFLSLNVQQVPQGTGTGFVWDAQGHIVTNFHVIQDANAARVTLADQSSYKAELVGAFRTVIWPCCASRPPRPSSSPCPWAPAGICRSDRRSMPSATPSAWTSRSPPASSARWAARSSPSRADRSRAPSRPMPPSTPATPAARCSIRRAGSSA